MKKAKTFNYCEHCNTPITKGISKENYKKGLIHINAGTLMLPPSVVKKNRKPGIADSHATFLDGYYCNWECLKNYLKSKLHV